MRYLMLAPLMLLAACGGGEEPGAEMRRVGMADPAPALCARMGGRMEMRQEQGGLAGYCHLKDGSTLEEWKLYRDADPL